MNKEILSKAIPVFTLALALLIFVFSLPFWHSFATQESFTEIALHEFDESINENNACFALKISSFNEQVNETLKVSLVDSILFSQEIILQENENTTVNACLENSAFVNGENTVDVFFGEKHLYFNVLKGTGEEKKAVFVTDHEGFSGGGLPFINPLLFILFFLSFFFFIFLFVKKFGLLHGVIISIVLFILFSLLRVFLNYFNILQDTLTLSLLYFLFFASACFLIYKRFSFESKIDSFEKKAFASSVIVLFFVLFLHLFSASHFSEWNVFYERQTEAFIDSDRVPEFDSLSYLGRPASFVPGYFLFESAIAKLSSIQLSYLFAVSLFFANLLFILSSFFFSKAIGFSFRKSLLFLLILLMLNSIFIDFLSSPRLSISLALLLYGVALLVRNNSRNWVWPALVFAALFAIKIPAMFFSVFLLFFLYPKRLPAILNLKHVLVFSSAFIIFLLVYSKVLLENGLPFTAKVAEWGYLASINFDWFLFDSGVAVFLLAITVLLSLVFFKSLSYENKWLLAGLLLALFLEFFVTFRFNVVVQILLAILAIKLFFDVLPQSIPKIFNQKTVFACFVLFILLFAIALMDNVNKEQYSFSNESKFSAFSFIKEHTPKNSNFLSNPLDAHSLAFFGERKVLADLYVEYADAEKLNAEYDFLLNAKESILKEYGIDFVFLKKSGVLTAMQFCSDQAFHEFEEDRFISFMHKVYENEEFAIYYYSN